MDKLEEIFEIQKKFTELFFKEKCGEDFLKLLPNSKDELIKWNKEYILAIIKETTELLDEIDWKTHHSKFDDDVLENFIEEAVDVSKYLIGLLIVNGFSITDFYSKFKDKSEVVELKFKQNKLVNEIKNNKDKKIAIIDIDGVLVKFPENFINFVNNKLNCSFKNLDEIKRHNEIDYYKLKKDFRSLGFEGRSGEIIKETKELIDDLKNNKIFIILLTARPYKKYFRLFSDTLKWLRENNVYFDAIIWEEEKAEFIVNSLKNNEVVFCVDDDIDNVNKLAQRFKTYLLKNEKLFSSKAEMNKKIKTHVDKRVLVINNVSEIKL